MPTNNLGEVVDVDQGTCVIDGCVNPVLVKKRGWCNAHYLHWQRYGDPLVVRRPPVSPESIAARFAKYVGDPDPVTGCTEWTGGKDSEGYGAFSAGGSGRGRLVKAARWAYERHCGSIPDGLWVLHRCDNPPCVRPDHLFLGTHVDNMADKRLKGRQARNRGEMAGGARLTWAQVREIRARYKGRGKGPTMAQLATEYGVHHVTVWQVIHGVTWQEGGHTRDS